MVNLKVQPIFDFIELVGGFGIESTLVCRQVFHIEIVD
jgi:hypothetical protein